MYTTKSKMAALAAAVGIPAALLLGIKLRYPTILQDIGDIRGGFALIKAINALLDKKICVIDVFEEQVEKIPNKTFIFYQDECHTFGQVDGDANKLANFVRGTGKLQAGDTVAFVLPNSPMYVSSHLGLAKLGIRTSFVNFNLRHQSLLHCIKICEAKVVLCTEDFFPGLKDIQDDLQKLEIEIWIIGDDVTAPSSGAIYVDTSNASADPIPKELRKTVTMDDPAGYMYTSGTTGLPKAVRMKNSRWTKALFVAYLCEVTQDDVIYCALPLYHGSGFGFGVLTAIRTGCSVVIAPKFSASRFWDDVRRYRATVVQYIGELCRYVCAQPRSDKDGKYDHCVRAAIGNGLRPDIWAEFKNRFNIGRIYEFYAATEGNFLSMNMDGKEGSVGRYPKLIHDLVGNVEIIKCDMATAEPIRDVNGHCIPVPTGETGLLVSKITKLFTFDGYKASKETNEKKILRNVRKEGDQYFNTGDLMMLDSTGHLYFCDRLGDTFRWKGENVATTEVAAQLNKYPGVEDTNVYGVKVPGQDGRAGMAAITLKKDSDDLNLGNLYQHVKNNLPMYACPKFVRILPEVILTGTFKHKKVDLMKEGFDPTVVSDTLYFMEVSKETYVPLDKEVYQSIVDGLARL